jgi:hypothetical protein
MRITPLTYCALPIDNDTKDPLQWWIAHKAGFPVLSRLAFDLLSIPAMSSECERAFSKAGYMVTGRRNGVEADIIEATEMLRSWVKAGVVSM